MGQEENACSVPSPADVRNRTEACTDGPTYCNKTPALHHPFVREEPSRARDLAMPVDCIEYRP